MWQPQRISPLVEIRSAQAHNSQSHINTPHSPILGNTIHRCPSSIAASRNTPDLSVGYHRYHRTASINHYRTQRSDGGVGNYLTIRVGSPDTTIGRWKVIGSITPSIIFSTRCWTIKMFSICAQPWPFSIQQQKKMEMTQQQHTKWIWLNNNRHPGSLMIMEDKGVTK